MGHMPIVMASWRGCSLLHASFRSRSRSKRWLDGASLRETMRHGLPPGVYTNITCVVSLFITLGLFLTVNVYQLGDAGFVEHGRGRGSRFRKLTHIPTHPDVFDPSYKRRGDVDDEELDAENEEIDLTDYSPWYYTYVNSTNQTIDYRRTGTGNIRVCNNGEEPRPTKDMYCMENRLNKKTVSLQSGLD